MQHIIKLAMVLLAVVATYFVGQFTALVAPWYIAVGAAGSLVATYIGLAFASIPTEQRQRANRVAVAAMLIEAAYGTLYVLHVQNPGLFEPPLPLLASVPLALLHGSPFTVLLYFVSLFIVHERVEAVPVAPDATALLITVLERLTLPAPALPRQEQYPLPEEVDEGVLPTTGGPEPLRCRRCGATAAEDGTPFTSIGQLGLHARRECPSRSKG